MAAADDTANADTPASSPPKKKSGGLGMLIAAVLLSAGAAGGISWFVSQQAVSALKAAGSGEDEDGEPVPEVPRLPAHYFALEPAFVVNLDAERSQRFLQVQVEVMTRDPGMIERVQRHAPRIRSSLLLLFGQQKPEVLATRAGKEALQAEVLNEIRNILRAETGKTDIEAIYFTSFVMQ